MVRIANAKIVKMESVNHAVNLASQDVAAKAADIGRSHVAW